VSSNFKGEIMRRRCLVCGRFKAEGQECCDYNYGEWLKGRLKKR